MSAQIFIAILICVTVLLSKLGTYIFSKNLMELEQEQWKEREKYMRGEYRED